MTSRSVSPAHPDALKPLAGACIPGGTVTGSPHSVVVNLPTMASVHAYETKDPAFMACVRSGYPRFVMHEWIVRATDIVARRLGWEGRPVFLVPDATAAARLVEWSGARQPVVREVDGFVAVCVEDDPVVRKCAAEFQQHTGARIGSRQAEDFLIAGGVLPQRHAEAAVADPVEADARVRECLQPWFAGADMRMDLLLANSGMNAFHAAFESLRRHQAARGRTAWIQFGWLYLDTASLLAKSGGERILLSNVQDFAALEACVAELGGRIAGIVCETPTNPTLGTADLARLSDLARRAGAALVLDPTVSSPVNIDVLPHADVVVLSLTKYAAGEGDVMAGAVVVNPSSPFASPLRAALPGLLIAPYCRDLGRLAHEIPAMESLVRAVNGNAKALVAFLEGHPAVDRVWHPGAGDSAAAYASISREGGGPGCMVSFTTKLPIARVYDALRCPKGPSFGTSFTFAVPFLYLVYFDLATTDAGRAYLRSQGVDPDIIRVSVGAEPVDELLSIFREALG